MNSPRDQIVFSLQELEALRIRMQRVARMLTDARAMLAPNEGAGYVIHDSLVCLELVAGDLLALARGKRT